MELPGLCAPARSPRDCATPAAPPAYHERTAPEDGRRTIAMADDIDAELLLVGKELDKASYVGMNLRSY